jgi:hypothetical protein
MYTEYMEDEMLHKRNLHPGIRGSETKALVVLAVYYNFPINPFPSTIVCLLPRDTRVFF